MARQAAVAGKRTMVWDAPLRLFHWALAASFLLAWLWQGDRLLGFHLLAGYLFTALLLFRLAWGFVGGYHARFRSFLYGPVAAARHLGDIVRGNPRRYTGHNPAGSWAIYAMLALGILTGITGVITLGAEERHGPLAGVLGFQWGTVFHAFHKKLAWVLLSLVLLHLAAVVTESLLQRENLPLSMISGRKAGPGEGTAVDTPPRFAVALFMAAGMLFFSLWWLQGRFTQTAGQPGLAFTGAELPASPRWQDECGACHLAYHPSLLPARSWKRILDEQADHFGEDLVLDEAVTRELAAFAQASAAETSPTEASWKILHGIAADAVPQRISATAYWKDKHGDIPEHLWQAPGIGGRYNCDACHFDADRGWFEDGAMRIPAKAVDASVDSGGWNT